MLPVVFVFKDESSGASTALSVLFDEFSLVGDDAVSCKDGEVDS